MSEVTVHGQVKGLRIGEVISMNGKAHMVKSNDGFEAVFVEVVRCTCGCHNKDRKTLVMHIRPCCSGGWKVL